MVRRKKREGESLKKRNKVKEREKKTYSQNFVKHLQWTQEGGAGGEGREKNQICTNIRQEETAKKTLSSVREIRAR